MDTRRIGSLTVSVVGLGCNNFGIRLDAAGTAAVVNAALDAGVDFFDTADIYGRTQSEVLLGRALGARRKDVVVATKFGMKVDDAKRGAKPAYVGQACEDSLRRLGTDHIDVYYMHGFDANTPIDETLRALDDLSASGKVGHIGCCNFSGWHLMKSLAISDRYGWRRYVAHQAYYSLAARDYEWELMPLAIDQRVGTVVWSPLAGGALTGKIRRGQPVPEGTRARQLGLERAGDLGRLYDIVDALEEVARDIGRTISQVALAWVLQRPTVASVVIGARNEVKLRENLADVEWKLDEAQVAKLDAASETRPSYPYWHQRLNPRLNPPPVPVRGARKGGA
jgi:aryl-alcohol dehydrogenase-like predicted oxidoreductase